MAKKRRGPEIGTAGFSIIDPPVDASLEDFEPSASTGRVPAQDEDLERGRNRKRRMKKTGSSADRK